MEVVQFPKSNWNRSLGEFEPYFGPIERQHLFETVAIDEDWFADPARSTAEIAGNQNAERHFRFLAQEFPRLLAHINMYRRKSAASRHGTRNCSSLWPRLSIPQGCLHAFGIDVVQRRQALRDGRRSAADRRQDRRRYQSLTRVCRCLARQTAGPTGIGKRGRGQAGLDGRGALAARGRPPVDIV